MVRVVLLALFGTALISPELSAQTEEKGSNFSQFGFGPALYFVRYNDEIIDDSRQIVIRSDSTIDFPGSRYAVPLGLEVHYSFSLRRPTRYRPNSNVDWQRSTGLIASPFLGIYDVDNGVDGLAGGVLIGYWKGDGNFNRESVLNAGVGVTVHRNQVVLAEGIEEGMRVPSGFTETDLTTLRDVWGFQLLISATVGF